ncbi:glycosyltransferase [Terribacillus sp. 179-K 1B1 HS]|uniref:glycosyltransferase n=1 Tax=Terribacillus sp. 179-K 1B1 HS TaxID=3142388 RepID=UPI0039A320DD
MKVSFVLNCINKLGGTEKATIDLANLLAKNNYKVHIISLYKEINSEQNSYNLHEKIKVSFVFPNTIYLKKPLIYYRLKDTFSKKQVEKIIRLSEPNYVLYTDIKQIPFYKSTYQKYLMVHNSYEFYRTGLVTKKLLDKNHKEIDNIIFLSGEDLKKYEKEFNYPGNADFVYNVSNIVPTVRTNHKNRTITFLGRIDNNQKQLEHALNVVKKLANENKYNDWIFNIYGSGPDETSVKKFIEDNNLSDRIKLKGTTSDVEGVLSTTDIMILTSKYEGLPMALIEAASSGVPIVSYECSDGIKEIVKDNYNGYLVERNNEEDLFNKLTDLIGDLEKRQTMGNNAINHVKEKFSEDSILQKWIKIFK